MSGLLEAFGRVLSVEDDIRQFEVELEGHTKRLTPLIQSGKLQLTEAWNRVAALMGETGEYEVLLPLDERSDYKIAWTKPRESVKVENPDAVPDEFVKLERKPMLKEIGEHLRSCELAPNWARFERGESKLKWEIVKHKVKG